MKLFSITTAIIMTATALIAESDQTMSSGVVTKVDTQWNKITIDHGPLENLDMPAMKMVFNVADPAMLDGVGEGAQIQFIADRVNGKLTVTEINSN
ncbi:copper-binding protein (plasmid) [Roseivivax marinus]|mgnify:CR=1 FL=1|uniref:copper-binding protein n=1 Tax=Roseivivax marinus TaxID=1379903 RepID=UPI001F043401|nr:copper-binding protein [Roseivivax marinus]UMA67372.1 copper-binding protein [Roseivivax marinus]